MRLGPLQDFFKQEDRSISRFAIRDSSLANHVVDRSRLEPQQLREFFHVEKLRPFLVFTYGLNLGAHGSRFGIKPCAVGCEWSRILWA